MPDEVIFENLQLIAESLDLITKRFSKIKQPNDIVSHHYEQVDHEIFFACFYFL